MAFIGELRVVVGVVSTNCPKTAMAPYNISLCRFVKNCAWLTVVAQSLLIIASRKHYTVDVVVAW